MIPEISVIIPTRNEAEHLSRTLASLGENSANIEIIVVDAASDDGTADIAEEAGATVLRAERGSRSGQMNLGARRAAAPVLLFLHADTRVAPGGIDRIVRTLTESPAVAGGAFYRRFDSPSLLLRATAVLAGLRSRHLGILLGDQGIFARRDVYEELNGFDESLALCEDLDFARRLGRKGRVVTLRPPVVSSARRFEARGPLRTTLEDVRHAWRYFRRPRG